MLTQSGFRVKEYLQLDGIDGFGDKRAAQDRRCRARADRSCLELLLGSAGPWLHDLANGIDERSVEPDVAAKSIGAEETFEEDLLGQDLNRSSTSRRCASRPSCGGRERTRGPCTSR